MDLLDYDEELSRLLSEYKLHPTSFEVKQSGGATYATLSVFIASGGAMTALVHILHKFLNLRQEKSFSIETEDGLKIMTKGASIDEVERAIRAVSKRPLGERDAKQ